MKTPNENMGIIDIDAQIISLLELTLIHPNGGLIDIYRRINDYYKIANQSDVKISDADRYELKSILPPNLLSKNDLVGSFKYLSDEPIRTMAIDFPILLKSRAAGRRRIMVCAMDSLPANDDKEEVGVNAHRGTEAIQSWAPFGIIDNWNLARGTAKCNIDFFLGLYGECDLYVTDIYKMFYRTGGIGNDARSNSDKRYTNLKYHVPQSGQSINMHSYILEREIEIIRPDIILTLGNSSRNALYSLCDHKAQNWGDDYQSKQWKDGRTRIISVPHIANTANGAKAAILANPKYESVGGANNEKLANIVLAALKEVGG